MSNELPKLNIVKEKFRFDDKLKLKVIAGINSAELPYDPKSPNNNNKPNMKHIMIPNLNTSEIENKKLKDEIQKLK